MSESSEIPPSEALRRAEEYWLARESLEEELRRGFVELSGARMRVRSSTVPFNATTWPASTQALLTISPSGAVQLKDENDTAWVRAWLGGARPSEDSLAAQRSFREVLARALKLVELQRLIAHKQE